MSPEVTAAWIAAGGVLVTVIATVIVQIVGFRSTKASTEQQIKATQKDTADTLSQQSEHLETTLAEQREQLDKTLKAQSEQLDRTLAEQRIRTLNERFGAAAEQLGSDKPAVRLAGVYAMAGLADDWEENRQTCVNVLCAYLRMPYEPEPGQDAPEPERLAFRAIREVRHTVIGVIAAHLKEDAAVSWQGLNLDFTSVVFDGGDFSYAQFSGSTVKFRGAQFTGGTVTFDFAKFSGGTVDFNHARFTGGTVSFNFAEFAGGAIRFGFAQFSGGTVLFGFTKFSGSAVYFNNARFSSSEIIFNLAQFSGGTVKFTAAQFSGGTVVFDVARFTGGTVSFGSMLDGVDVGGAQFSGGLVDFSGAADWSSPPEFPWTDTPPVGVKLPEQEDQAKV